MPRKSIIRKPQEIYQTYLDLPEDQRFLVQIYAVMYEAISQARAHSIWLAAMGLQDSFEKVEPLSVQSFRPQVRQLINEGLLKERTGMGAQCAPEILEIALRDAMRMLTFEPIARTVQTVVPVSTRYPRNEMFFRNEQQFMRELRIAIYRQDRSAAEATIEAAKKAYWQSDQTLAGALYTILTNPFDANWLDSLSDEFFELGVSSILKESVRQCLPATEAFELLENHYRTDRAGIGLSLAYVEQLWLRGELAEAAEVLAELKESFNIGSEDSGAYLALSGAIAFLTGNTEAAISHYRQSLKAVGNTQRAQAQWFQQPAALLYFFALFEQDTPTAVKEAEKHILLLQRTPSSWLNKSAPLLFALAQQQQGKLVNQRFDQHSLTAVGLLALLESYCLHWLNVDEIADWVSLQLPWLCKQMLKAEYGWMALETAELLVNYQPESPFTTIVETLRDQADSLVLLDIIEKKEPWERSLDVLTALVSPDPLDNPPPSLEPTYRMIWRLRFHSLDNWTLIPVEQKLSVKGGWTRGKTLTPKKLYSSYGRPAYLEEQDRRICETIEVHYDDGYHYRTSSTYAFSSDALIELVGHPRVFLEESPEVRVEIIAGEPELMVKRLEDERLRLSLSPQLTRRDVMVVKETPTRIKVIEVSDQHKRIAEVLGPANRLEVPMQAEERVLKAIASIANLVTVQSDIGGGVEAAEVLANAIPHVHLLPAGDGLRVSILAHPFPEGGTSYKPGEGGETVIAVVDGNRLKTQRDLKGEKQNAEAVSAQCPVLLHYEPEFGEWLIDDPQDCLELLMQLQQLEENVVVEWPEGEKFKVSRQLGMGDFKFDIRRKQDWFAASGELRVSDSQVVDLQQLMTLLENTPGQFVPLKDGEFLALTDEFRQRLKTLSRLSQRSGKSLKIDRLAALAIDDMIDDFEDLKVDQQWRDHLKQIKSAQSIQPEVPDALQATLRDYQRDGYVWLSRLANWGVGACLADDMGLGKTLQGLAVMLDRAEQGPALVIAPTSVCMNWSSEAARFAPSLRVQSLGEGERTERQDLLNKLGSNDLLVCSYGLVQQQDVADMLAEVSWETIVLDEAQAIKNHATKRSQAVMALEGKFKIIMTGTPIENHLGELWNLFRFINPGLLGSLDNFNFRFANPIERDQDDAASDALRRLIRPFILRRTKDQVLKELPSRTEITVSVELSKEETAFYEALRRDAVAKLKGNSDVKAGQRHLQVLAEIMKLRRACCNPSLVKPELAIPSTKLERFDTLISELLENGHKALVFSQFVDHLKILKNHLDEQQITYQYLDGSTPAKKRKQGVEAFQNGEGDVFLISLKAGGSGLNLTAADYVLHMDPWWNPAVEDQASDRAHRIGQQRPVTIYRLVAKGTIEDKIVGLHKVKRDLADSLLAGSDMSSKVSTDELLSLIQQ